MTSGRVRLLFFAALVASCDVDPGSASRVDAFVADSLLQPVDLGPMDLGTPPPNRGTPLSNMATFAVGGIASDHRAIVSQTSNVSLAAISLLDGSRLLAPRFPSIVDYVSGHSLFDWRNLGFLSSPARVWTPSVGASVEVMAAVPGVEATDATGRYVFLTDGVPPDESSVDLMVISTDGIESKVVAETRMAELIGGFQFEVPMVRRRRSEQTEPGRMQMPLPDVVAGFFLQPKIIDLCPDPCRQFR